MAKQWKFITTNYRNAWLAYRRTSEYKMHCELLKGKGMKQPYINNVIQQIFAAGFNSTNVQIKIIS